MIQFNLLPDVKQQYIKTNRRKRTVIVVSFLIAASSLAVFVVLFLSVYVFQKNHINNLSNDIKSSTQKLKDIPDLNKVLTIQNQLKELPDLHAEKPVTSRLFGYLNKLTPNQITIGNIKLDYSESTMTLTGSADSLSTVNKFVDTLKFSTYTDTLQVEQKEKKKVFSEVVLTSFSRSDKDATYTISFKFDPLIFDSSHNIEITVPNITSSRSETEKPTELFKALPEKKTEQ